VSPETAAALEREALRLFDRYTAELVEGLGLCPWAAAARAAGEVERRVILDAAPSVEQLAAAVDEVAARPGVVIGILILPRLAADPAAHRRLAEAVGAAHRRRGGGTPMAIADFHPDAACDLGSPARLVPFLRRTPDPTLQLVRLAALDAIKRAPPPPSLARQAALLAGATAAPAPPIADRIAAANAATVARLGPAAVAALLDDIRADRDRAYRRLLGDA
jgi:hypothetical protein